MHKENYSVTCETFKAFIIISIVLQQKELGSKTQNQTFIQFTFVLTWKDLTKVIIKGKLF